MNPPGDPDDVGGTVHARLELLESVTRTANRAGSLEEALDRGPIDLVFMDIQMPDIDGIEATERIRADLPEEDQPRIVALTAHAGGKVRDQAEEAGLDAYVTKPVEPDELVAEIEKTMPRSEPGEGGG